MPEPEKKDTPPAHDGKPASTGQPHESGTKDAPPPGDGQHHQMVMDYVQHAMSHPSAGKLAAHYAAMSSGLGSPPGGGLSMPSGSNTAPPPTPPLDSPPGGGATPYSRDQARMIQYERELADLRGVVARLQDENALLAYSREIEKRINLGYRLDLKEEMDIAKARTPEQRDQHLKYIDTHVPQAPVGQGFVPTATGAEGTNGNGRAKRPKSSEEVNKLVRAAELKGIKDIDQAMLLYERGELTI